MKDKILHAVLQHKHDLDNDWSQWQREINIYTDIQELYIDTPIHEANAIFAFVILAYHNESKWIDIHKDRLENKKKIMKSLLGDWALGESTFTDVIYGRHEKANNIINWLFDYIKDWRWQAIEAAQFLQALTTEAVRSSTKDDDLLSKGKALAAGIKNRQEAEKLLSQIQEEFVTTDSICETEGMVKITDRISGNSTWEQFIAQQKKAK